MSSIATFYILPETKRVEFTDAHRNQKTITFKRTLFGRKEVVTGDRFLWEYLDAANADRTDFPFSGFAFIEYFFTFVASTLPKDMESALAGAAVDEHHYVFSAQLAASFAEYLRLHPPESAALSAFVAEHNPTGGAEYVRVLGETHDFLLRWFSRIASGSFGVLHITF
jgi:hypothetical protein